jgi:uncharacterized protein (DUF58 family)
VNKVFSIVSNLYIARRFYYSAVFLILLFITGYLFDPLYLIAKILLLVLTVFILFDFYLLFFTHREILLLKRELPDKFSNGDINRVNLYFKNVHVFPVDIKLIDEIPVQFQVRNFSVELHLGSQQEKQLEYILRPTSRGIHTFGRTLAYVKSPVALLERRCVFNKEGINVPVYPSFLNIRKYELMAISNTLTDAGIKRIRRTGHHTEFEQIRDYVAGDDSRTVNWKATAKRGKLMVNQYRDERSQQIYSIIDMGRLMQMPFNNLTLLDYSINSSLIIANTALFKHDKPGLITFNTTVNTFIAAERKSNTLLTMLEALYDQQTRFAESNYELLFASVKKLIPHRSLLIMYTNFESMASLKRQLPYFQRISRSHLLLVVVFLNTEIEGFRKKESKMNLEAIYDQTIAERFIFDKTLITHELNKHGILSVLTRPADLTLNLVNKYLELKERGLI